MNFLENYDCWYTKTLCLGFEASPRPQDQPQACHSAQSPVQLAHRCVCYGLIRSLSALRWVDIGKKIEFFSLVGICSGMVKMPE